MSRAADPTQQGAPVATPAQIIAASLRDKHVCPFCGTIKDNPESKCLRCTLEDTPAIRQATKARIGPWHVLQARNPAAPGMRFATLLALVQKGQVTARSIIRGPTTHQLWRFAARVKGLSREFGVCYGCGGDLKRSDRLCPQCQRVQDPPSNPDVLLENWTSAAAGQNGQGEQNVPTSTVGRPTDMVVPAISGQRAVPSAADSGPSRPRGFVPPQVVPAAVAQLPSQMPEQIPTRDMADSQRLPAGRIIDPAQLADTLAIRLEPRGPRKMARSLGLFLLMTLVGVATWLLIDRDTWRVVSTWFSDSFSAVRGNWRETDVPSPRTKTPPTIPPTTPPKATSKSPVTPPVAAPITPPTVHRDPTDVILDPPDRAIEEARRLWREALDCEAANDWPGAVGKYEAIKKLPPTAWPGAVDTYLSRAKEHLR